MRTKDDKKKFLEMLREYPNVSVVCKRISIAKATIYRWADKDTKFDEAMTKALTVGREGVTDLAEGQLISRIKKGEMRAIEYWLDNNNKRYIKPRYPLERYAEYKGVTQFNIQLYKGEKKETYTGETKPPEKIVDDKPEILE